MQSAAASKLKLSDVRIVTFYFQNGISPSTYMIPAADIDKFVQASKRLHVSPGINPHNGGEAYKVWKITVGTLELTGPYWWSTPDLKENFDPAGARVINEGLAETVFLDREYYLLADA